jgi:acyl carrier protein
MTVTAHETGHQQIVSAIVTALEEVLRQELTDVTEQTRLFDDLSLDSTSVLGLLMALEDNLDMQVDPEGLEQSHLETIGALATFIAESR